MPSSARCSGTRRRSARALSWCSLGQRTDTTGPAAAQGQFSFLRKRVGPAPTSWAATSTTRPMKNAGTAISPQAAKRSSSSRRSPLDYCLATCQTMP